MSTMRLVVCGFVPRPGHTKDYKKWYHRYLALGIQGWSCGVISQNDSWSQHRCCSGDGSYAQDKSCTLQNVTIAGTSTLTFEIELGFSFRLELGLGLEFRLPFFLQNFGQVEKKNHF